MSELLPCNKCGECCKVGGKCEMRRLHPMMVPIEFVGRCEFLIDQPDGTAICERMIGINPNATWFRKMVPGSCDFVELRKEIVSHANT